MGASTAATGVVLTVSIIHKKGRILCNLQSSTLLVCSLTLGTKWRQNK